MNILNNDIVVRALKTFVQSALAVLAVGYTEVVDLESGKALVIAAVAAGISAVWNTIASR